MLLACFGVGAAAAGIVLTFCPATKPTRSWFYVAILGVGICQVAVGRFSALPVAAFITGLAGACFVGAMIELGSSIISATPDEFRGRVSSVQQVFFRASQPLGAFAAGCIAQPAGTSAMFAIFGVFLILVAILNYWSPRFDNLGAGSEVRRK